MTLPTIAGVQSRIHTLPGRPPFMTVYDLAEFYQVKPARIMEQVRRNAGRFPAGYIFELDETEISGLVTQNALPNRLNRGIVLGFTEKGALQLSSVLTSPVAEAVSVVIIDAFVALRDGREAALRLAAFKDETAYIGRSRMRLAIKLAAQDGWSFSKLWGENNWSAPALGREVEEMRLRGYIARDALIVPAYVFVRRRAEMELMDLHVEDARQMRLGLEG